MIVFVLIAFVTGEKHEITSISFLQALSLCHG
jgi:hypothetical protein